MRIVLLVAMLVSSNENQNQLNNAYLFPSVLSYWNCMQVQWGNINIAVAITEWAVKITAIAALFLQLDAAPCEPWKFAYFKCHR